MKSKGEDDEEERMEDHSGNCSVSLHSLSWAFWMDQVSGP